MFSKTTYFALAVMMEAALAYDSGERIDLAFVSQKHAIPPDAFEGVVEVLQNKHLNRLRRYKLSDWSEKANKTIYI